MKITPSEMQLRYLKTIGAIQKPEPSKSEKYSDESSDDFELFYKETKEPWPPERSFITYETKADEPSPPYDYSEKPRMGNGIYVILTIIILLLLAGISFSTPTEGSVILYADTTGNDQEVKDDRQIEEAADTVKKIIKDELGPIKSDLSDEIDDRLSEFGNQIDVLQSQYTDNLVEIDTLENEITKMGEIIAELQERFGEIEEKEQQKDEAATSEIQSSLSEHADNIRYLKYGMISFTALFALIVPFLIIDRVRLGNRVRNVASNISKERSEPDEVSSESTIVEKNSNEVGEQQQLTSETESHPDNKERLTIDDQSVDESKTHKDEAPSKIPEVPLSPTEKIEKLIAEAESKPDLQIYPYLPNERWRIGFASSKGNVRNKNEDYTIGFKIGDKDVCIVADGCGGHSFGDRASYLACLSAATSIIEQYGKKPEWFDPEPKDVAAKSIIKAEKQLAVEAKRRNISDGLKTTLIVVIGAKDKFGYAYIGDGGGYIVKSSDGKLENFLIPDKVDGSLNELTACLGPEMRGQPKVGSLKRESGDIVIIGTDGIFDLHIDREQEFLKQVVVNGSLSHKGDLQNLTEDIVDEIINHKDEVGYLADDNVTIGIIGDGNKPKFLNENREK